MVLLLAHHQLLCYCSLAQPEPRKRIKQESGFTRLYLWDCLCGQKCDAEISTQSQLLLFFLLRSSSVHSILGLTLTTLVATFLDSSKCGPHAWYCSYSSGTPSSDHDIMTVGKKECWQHWTCSYSLSGEVRALDTQ